MRRKRQLAIRAAMEGSSPAAIRRVRRDRNISAQLGKGHGKRVYKSVVAARNQKAASKRAETGATRLIDLLLKR